MASYDTVALLPMKAHSERVSGKNFRPLAGKPLFRWILDTLLAVPAIDCVVINTDARDILADNGLVDSERVLIRDRRPEICGDLIDQNCDGSDIGCEGDGDGDFYLAPDDCDDEDSEVFAREHPVTFATAKPDAPFLVLPAQVSHAVPKRRAVIDLGQGIRFGSPKIATGYQITLHNDFPDFAGRQDQVV